MKYSRLTASAAACVAALAASSFLCSCEGRKMSNMKPSGETVEVVIGSADESVPQQDQLRADSAASDSTNL